MRGPTAAGGQPSNPASGHPRQRPRRERSVPPCRLTGTGSPGAYRRLADHTYDELLCHSATTVPSAARP